MNGYLDISQSPDFLPIALSRTFSSLSRSWLRGYVEICRRILNEEETSEMMHCMDGQVAQMLVNRREIRIRLDNENLLKDESAHNIELSKALITDTIGAHEIGKGGYPGHYELLLEQGRGLLQSLYFQDKLNYEAASMSYFLDCNDRILKAWSDRFLTFAGQYLQFDWFSEMFALILAQKKRLTEHLGNKGLAPQIRLLLEERLKQIDSIASFEDVYGTGLYIYEKLKEKFKNKIELVLSSSLTPLVADDTKLNEIEAKIGYWDPFKDPRVFNQSLRVTGEILVPPHMFLLVALESEGIDNDLSGIYRKLEELCFLNPRPMPKSVYFTRLLGNSDIELPDDGWILPVAVGDIWLALHSMVNIVVLSKSRGVRITLISKAIQSQLDSTAIKIAYQILELRNTIMMHIRFQMDPLLCRIRYRKVIEIAAGELPFRNYMFSKTHTGFSNIHIEFDRDIFRPFESLPQVLKEYYFQHKRKLDRYREEPELFFERVFPQRVCRTNCI